MLDFLTPTQIEYVAIFFVALAVILTYLIIHRMRELFKEKVWDLHKKISPWGIEPLNKLLKAVVIDNFIGKDSMGRVIREIHADLRGDGLIIMLRKLGWKIVKNEFLKKKADRAMLADLLAKAEVAAEPEEEEDDEYEDEE